MEQSVLKTTVKQRIIAGVVAVLLLGSTIATYAAIVLAGNKNNENEAKNSAELTELENQYTAKQSEINKYAAELSDKYFSDFSAQRTRIKSYNASAANSAGLKTVDIKKGTGRELTSGDTDYFAYYIGWCADESVFDSSFNDSNNPTALRAPLSAAQGLITGWNEGVIGMKLGGIREITIPGELAYGDTQEICGGTNSPLKFLVLPIADSQMKKLNAELEDIYSQILALYYR